MSNLSIEVDNLKSNYRKCFLEISEEIETRLEKVPAGNQKAFLSDVLLKEIFEKWLNIINHKTNFSCAGCAACCKLACSEFSPAELKQKAQNGDNFANQFLSVFVPYETEADAQKIYPEYFELLKTKAPNEKIYFYHCPKVTKENRCTDYENRPQICRDFPDNPIGFLPKTCGFNQWKQDVESSALKLRAAFEIIGFYKQKLS